MDSLAIFFKKLHPQASTPRQASDLAAGWDVTTTKTVTIGPHTTHLVGTGLAVAIPKGWELELHPRSSLGVKFGLILTNSVGTIDADYRGEIKAALHNLTDAPVTIANGTRICQLKPRMVQPLIWVERTTLDATERGTGGFGSTGER